MSSRFKHLYQPFIHFLLFVVDTNEWTATTSPSGADLSVVMVVLVLWSQSLTVLLWPLFPQPLFKEPKVEAPLFKLPGDCGQRLTWRLAWQKRSLRVLPGWICPRGCRSAHLNGLFTCLCGFVCCRFLGVPPGRGSCPLTGPLPFDLIYTDYHGLQQMKQHMGLSLKKHKLVGCTQNQRGWLFSARFLIINASAISKSPAA